MDDESRRAAALIAASFQASSPDEAVTIAEHYATWIQLGTLDDKPREELATTHGHDLDDAELEAERQRQQDARAQRRADKEAEKRAVRGEP